MKRRINPVVVVCMLIAAVTLIGIVTTLIMRRIPTRKQMDLILRVKLSLFNDSDTTRSRSVSLMPAHLPSKEKLKNRCIHSEFRVYY